MEFIQHDHPDLTRLGDCRACQAGMPDQINYDVPDECIYDLVETSIENILVCRRHGKIPKSIVLGIDYLTSSGPCVARKCEGEFADYVHDRSAITRPSLEQRSITDRVKRENQLSLIREMLKRFRY